MTIKGRLDATITRKTATSSCDRLHRHRHPHRQLEGPVLHVTGAILRAGQVVGNLLQDRLPQFDAGSRAKSSLM